MSRSSLYGGASLAPLATAAFAELKRWFAFVASHPPGMKIAGIPSGPHGVGRGVNFPMKAAAIDCNSWRPVDFSGCRQFIPNLKVPHEH